MSSRSTPGSPQVARHSSRVIQAAGFVQIIVFDIVGPLVLYSALRSNGWSAVDALVTSGAFPALGVLAMLYLKRRLDAIGILVLAGIAVGTILGLLTGSAKLTLIEGAVPTAVVALLFIASLWAKRPIMFRFALEFMGGPETPKGREFADGWQYPGFRHSFRVMTVVWGLGFFLEAVATVFLVETVSTSTALGFNKIAPYVVAGLLAAWTALYGKRSKQKGERRRAAAAH